MTTKERVFHFQTYCILVQIGKVGHAKKFALRFYTKLLLFFLPSKLHTQRFWFLEDTQGARFYDMHGTTLHLFVILFPVQYMRKRFASKLGCAKFQQNLHLLQVLPKGRGWDFCLKKVATPVTACSAFLFWGFLLMCVPENAKIS